MPDPLLISLSLNTARKQVQCISTVRFFYQSNKNVNVMFRKDCIPYQTETSSYLHFRDAARDVQFHSEMTLDTSEMCY